MQFGLRTPEIPDESRISRGSMSIPFRFHESALSMMEYENDRRVRRLSTGPFTLKIIMQTNCPILAHICCVDKFKWPLTKDTVVLRVTTRTYVIALPGLLYALQFPSLCTRPSLRILSDVFTKYGHFQDLRPQKLGGCSMQFNEPGMLESLRPHFEHIAHETLFELGNIPGISRFCMEDHNSSFLRACRMSAITKMIKKSMRLKKMTSSLVEINGTNPLEAHLGRAYAVASTYTRLVDSAEYASLVSCGLGEKLENVVSPLRFGSVDVGYQVWNLNQLGLLSFMSLLGPHVEEEVEYVSHVSSREEWWNAMAEKDQEEAEASAKDEGNEKNMES
ncbi:hypothetical protein JHK84_032431 [Glycine max]|uniref:Uncharacterized protein n=1 Tax=Glycine soja TaxID=3848 RepID=A0A0B2P6I3_GLYSO|nr:hypothetical protein JHK87_032122 [Glycine soja]KAG4995464.1 hypothetical protein JHK86_032291 [Glycine max]KAG5146888.1 hypothetical protein JHK84_032431 [Glycine max]KHN04821.1 hypothetical protein glysoja_031921 [Glycine soja]RZB73104.1 hypothetical protein D0Y65_037037 [Glycine soja]